MNTIPKTLSGLLIMVTRPLPNGLTLCNELEMLGAKTFYFPTIEIKPLPESSSFIHQIEKLHELDWLIFVSPHAVYKAAPIIQKYWPIFPDKTNIAAIGGGTAKALKEMHMPVTAQPEEWTSEGLLALPAFQHLQHTHLGIVRGDKGRTLLAEELTKRGATITHFIVYKRDMPHYPKPADNLRLLKTHEINIIICASNDSLQNLIQLCPQEFYQNLIHTPLLVVSERTLAIAEEYRFKKVFLAKNAGQDAIIETLKSVQRVHALKEGF